MATPNTYTHPGRPPCGPSHPTRILKPAFITVNNRRNLSTEHSLSLLDCCTEWKQIKQIHAHMLRIGLFSNPFFSNRLIAALSLSSFSNLGYAQKVFDEIPQPGLYSWNTLIRGCASKGDFGTSLRIFVRMLHHCFELPNKFTYPFVIKAASKGFDPRFGRGVHGMVVKTMLGSDLFVVNSLVHFYGEIGCSDIAYRVFLGIGDKDLVSWNSMISAFTEGGCSDKALDLFREMEVEGVRPNEMTMMGVFSACGKKGDLELARLMGSCVEKYKINSSLKLNNAMLDMYVKCGSIEDVKRVFDQMNEKDIVSWTTLLVGYSRLGDCVEACRVFDTMPMKDIATWNALISAHEQNGLPKEALCLFRRLLAEKGTKPDEVTFVGVLSASAQLGAIDSGRWVHYYMKKQGIELNCHLVTSLLDMYSKCGDLKRALEVFYSAERKDVFVWSAMIAGLAMHGHGRNALDLFSRMQESGVKPNAITFTNVLSACSHTGLINEGKRIFKEMEPVYGFVPESNHFSSMVDGLGRAGRLDEAMELINEMPMAPTASVWASFLGACRVHANVDLAELAFARLIELDPENHGAYVVLSNIYAKSGNYIKVSQLRKLMRDSRMKKQPGCSFISINNVVHEFLVADNSHPMAGKIYEKLDEVASRLKSIGHEPDKSQVLQIIEEEEMKDQSLYHHSEKLAIALGLLRLEPSQPIRVVKNLRVCGDCHTFAKIISRIYDREILLRDRYRFHHFKDGSCSCMDYW